MDNNKKDEPVIYDSFIDSIHEEIKKENYKKIWDKYGKSISAFIGIILIATIGYNSWKKQDLADREALSYSFIQAQTEINNNNTDKALLKFREIGKSSKQIYATLAKFEYAAALREKQDYNRVLKQYKDIFTNDKSPDELRHLAYIYYINNALDFMDNKELKQNIDKFIETLSNDFIGKEWDLLAKESLAYCYLKLNKKSEAKKVLVQLAKTEKIPDGMLDRTRKLIQYIDECKK